MNQSTQQQTPCAICAKSFMKSKAFEVHNKLFCGMKCVLEYRQSIKKPEEDSKTFRHFDCGGVC